MLTSYLLYVPQKTVVLHIEVIQKLSVGPTNSNLFIFQTEAVTSDREFWENPDNFVTMV
jgi:hypothetical protein